MTPPKCPKCGADVTTVRYHANNDVKECRRSKVQAAEEHLHLYCACGAEFTQPCADAGKAAE